MRNREIIISALTALLSRDSEDAFVVFEHAQSGKFVQFAGSATEPLLFDLPAQTLSELELERAVAFFCRARVSSEKHDVLDGPGGSVVGHRYSFNCRPGTVELAADLTSGVFHEIFGLAEGFDMVVTDH